MKLQSIENELGLFGDLGRSRSWYWQSEDTKCNFSYQVRDYWSSNTHKLLPSSRESQPAFSQCLEYSLNMTVK